MLKGTAHASIVHVKRYSMDAIFPDPTTHDSILKPISEQITYFTCRLFMHYQSTYNYYRQCIPYRTAGF